MQLSWNMAMRLSLCSIGAAFLFTSLFVLSFYNRLYIYLHRDAYIHDVFLVSKSYVTESSAGDEYGGGRVFHLTGSIAGQKEAYHFNSMDRDLPHSAQELTSRYPPGTKFDVLFNPTATEMLIQSESLRVIRFTPTFWEREGKLRRSLALCVLLPIPMTTLIYLLLSVVYKRNSRQECSREERNESINGNTAA